MPNFNSTSNFVQSQDTSQPSDVQALNSAAENAIGNDSSMEAQTTMEEQNEQQSQGTGSSQQVGEEGHDGISSVTKQETDGSKENKVRVFSYFIIDSDIHETPGFSVKHC